MNRLQLAQRIHLLTGAGGGELPGSLPAATTGAGLRGDLLRMVIAVDEAWRAIQTARRDWLFMRAEGLLTLVPGVQRYPIYQSSAGITASVTGRMATATTAVAHGLLAGRTVVISGAVQTQYNGTVVIFDVPTANTFRYLVVGAPITPATGTITYTVPPSGTPLSITGVVSSSDVVTLNAPAHDLNKGQTFFVSGAAVAAYNGTQTAVAVTPDTIQYLVPLGTTTPTAGTLALASSASLADYDLARPYFGANGGKPYLLVYRTTTGVSDEQPLQFLEPHDFQGYFDRNAFSTSTGRPVYYTILPGRRLAVFPWPEVGYTVRVPFRRRVQLLAADTDEPFALPEEFHPMIAYKGIMDFMGFQENSRQFQNASRLYTEMWDDLNIQQLPRISSYFGAER